MAGGVLVQRTSGKMLSSKERHIVSNMFNYFKSKTSENIVSLKANQTIQTLSISRASVFKIRFLYIRGPLVSPMKKESINYKSTANARFCPYGGK
jgi:hypothetical protein